MIKITEIVLLIITIAFCAALFLNIITGEQFLPVVLLVLGYFYGEKKKDEVEEAIAGAIAKASKIG
jgi:hypothetical protein